MKNIIEEGKNNQSTEETFPEYGTTKQFLLSQKQFRKKCQ